jgi:hypothetical protein
MSRRWIALFCLLIVCFNLYAQGEESEYEPEPYTEEEFADWMHNLRRFEIITFGTLPFTFLLSFFIYDVARYFASGYESDYRPISNPNPVPYTDSEKIGIVIAACSASVIIALTDFIIGKAMEGRGKAGSDGEL